MLIAQVIVRSKAELGVTEPLQVLVRRKPHTSSVRGEKHAVRVTFYDVPDQEAFLRAANDLSLTPTFRTFVHNERRKGRR